MMIKHGFLDIDTSKVYDLVGVQGRFMDSDEKNMYFGIHKVLEVYLSEGIRDPEVLQGIYEGIYILNQRKVWNRRKI